MTLYRDSFVYSACSSDFTPSASPTDVFTISGSSNSQVYIMKMGISTTQTTSGVNGWRILKRSTPNLGGTYSSPSIAKYNSQNPDTLASVVQFSANPATLGTSAGVIFTGHLNSPAPEQTPISGTIAGTDIAGVILGTFAQTSTPTSLGSSICEVCFLDQFAQPLTLRNQTESVSWNFGAIALPPGLSVRAYVIWYEQPKYF